MNIKHERPKKRNDKTIWIGRIISKHIVEHAETKRIKDEEQKQQENQHLKMNVMLKPLRPRLGKSKITYDTKEKQKQNFVKSLIASHSIDQRKKLGKLNSKVRKPRAL